MSPTAARLHEVVTGWLGDLLGLRRHRSGVRDGGSHGQCRRAHLRPRSATGPCWLGRAGPRAVRGPELTVVVGEKAHSTLIKALGLIGLGRERVRRIPADDQGRMRADCLPVDVAGPVVVCVQAGEVNTGAFDPFSAVIEWARERQAWVHADGAFGLWALADPSRSHLTAGWPTPTPGPPTHTSGSTFRMTAALSWSGGPRTSDAASPRWPVPPPGYRLRGHASHAAGLAARPASRGVGRPAHAGQARRGRSHRPDLRPCPGHGQLPAASGPGGAERGGAQPGAGAGRDR